MSTLFGVGLVLLASLSTFPWSDADPIRGRQAFVDLKCHACHRVAEDSSLPKFEGAWEGPLLHDLGKETAEAVAWKIVSRTSLGPESIYESPMTECASAMTERQLVDLVAYLRDPVRGKKGSKEGNHD